MKTLGLILIIIGTASASYKLGYDEGLEDYRQKCNNAKMMEYNYHQESEHPNGYPADRDTIVWYRLELIEVNDEL